MVRIKFLADWEKTVSFDYTVLAFLGCRVQPILLIECTYPITTDLQKTS